MPADADPQGGSDWSIDRRGALGVAGSAVMTLSGCTGLNRSDGGETVDRGAYDGTTLLWYLRERWLGNQSRADWATWFGTGAFPGTGRRTIGDVRYARPGAPWDATMARGMWGPWTNDAIRTGEPQYGLYEDVTIEPDELHVQLRSDAMWSTGDPVVGRDVAVLPLASRLIAKASFAEVDRAGPRGPIEAITDVEIGDDQVTFISDGDWFDEFLQEDIWRVVTRTATARNQDDPGNAGVTQHTGIEPYATWADALLDLWTAARTGEADPWSGELAVGVHLADAIPDAPGESWYEYFHEPANCPVTGAFKPTKIIPTEIVLKRNPEFYAADQVDIDTVVFPLAEDVQFHWGAMSGDRRDYLRGRLLEQVVESAPARIEHRLIGVPDGWALALNHETPPFDRRPVRQAIAFALDTEAIARTLHPLRFDPVTVPGDHPHDASVVTDGADDQEQLQEYVHDPEQAAERMRAAGFERSAEEWVTTDGEPVTIPMMSGGQLGDESSLVQVVTTQLEDFGLTVSQESMGVTPQGRRPAMWPIRRGVGYMKDAVGGLYRWIVATESRAREFGVFPPAQIDSAQFDENGRLVGDKEAFSLEAPPVGEPGGDRERWTPVELSDACLDAPTAEGYRTSLGRLAWLYNWHLPVIPIANDRQQHFLNTEGWSWPEFPNNRYAGVGVSQLQPEDLLALGEIGTAE